MNSYEVTAARPGQYIREEYDTAESAQARAEQLGSASVVRFRGHHNAPDRLPAIVWQSCGLWSYGAQGWREHYIYDGHGDAISTRSPIDCA
jgi:hypothetical protein